ncbi:unnamed protein product [Dibothriocephalus latus]|uniref:Uncharacterized protein n=1 Tax=Dibothriocephalus latus TaxID=60516 RepID=A0A3P7N507_DIBLA|nr:unnamed protein product [Dibothriocephalus latus]
MERPKLSVSVIDDSHHFEGTSRAHSPLEQIELILNLTGTPSMEDLEHCHPEACCFVLSFRPRRPNLATLYSLSPDMNASAVDLLSSMLRFNPVSPLYPRIVLSIFYKCSQKVLYLV